MRVQKISRVLIGQLDATLAKMWLCNFMKNPLGPN
jgi:hypothetical protein